MPDGKALVVIDVQLGMFQELEPVYRGEELLARIHALIANAREAGATVVFVQHNGYPGESIEPGTPGFAIHPSLDTRPDDVYIVKNTPSSFYETALQTELEQRGIHQLVLCGMQTEYCVDTTTRHAFNLGYESTLAADAHSTFTSGTLTASQIVDHHNQVLRSFADVVNTEAITFSA